MTEHQISNLNFKTRKRDMHPPKLPTALLQSLADDTKRQKLTAFPIRLPHSLSCEHWPLSDSVPAVSKSSVPSLPHTMSSDTQESDELSQPHKKSRIETADEILAELARNAVAALSQQSDINEETENEPEPPQSPATFLKRAGLLTRPIRRRQNVSITPPRLPGTSPYKQEYRSGGDVTPATAFAAQCLLELHR